MQRNMLISVATVVAATFGMLAAVQRFSAAASMVEKQDLIGVYGGYSQAIGHPDLVPVEATFEVTSQTNRRFDAVYIGHPDLVPEEFLLRGTVAASGNVHAYGESDTNTTIIEWRLEEFSPGAAVLEGRSKTIGNTGESLQANILLRDFPFDESNLSADASGTYQGEALSARDGRRQLWSLDAERRADSRTGFAGTLSTADEAGIVIIDGRFTLNGDGDVVLIGASPGRQVQILARFFNPQPDPPGSPARIEGTYVIYAVSDEENRGLGGLDPVDDVGTFVLVRAEQRAGELVLPGLE